MTELNFNDDVESFQLSIFIYNLWGSIFVSNSI
jgi:hypothetical protein